jgi:hypothetical protein
MSGGTSTKPLTMVRGRQHDFVQVDDGHYRLTVLSLGIQLDIERVRRERQQLIGELTVMCDLPGALNVRAADDTPILSACDIALSSDDARWKRSKLLADRSNAPDVDWRGLIEELATRTIAAERAGSPARPLHTFERAMAGADADFEVEGWRLLRDHPVIAYGDGGSAKSYLALFIAGKLAQRGLTVLYADWELTGGDHRDRLERLFGPTMPIVHYLRCDRPLILEVDRVQREARRLSVDYWIADSIAFAVGGPPEAAEHATAYFRAVRQIGLGSLHLAHVNRSENGDQKPFGSSFWHNSSRATWFIKQADAAATGERITIGLFNKKSNLTRQHPAVGFSFEFADDRTAVSRVDLADVEDLAGNLPMWQRVRHLIKSGGGVPLSIGDIAEELDAKPDTIKKAVARSKSVFVQVPDRDGSGMRIGLVERRAS